MPKLVGTKVEFRFDSSDLPDTNTILDDLKETSKSAELELRVGLDLDLSQIMLVGCRRDKNDQNAIVLTYIVNLD